ncbi:MAG: PSD1 and planctomycete cytochrome C domain-containing protein [Verrucomicrobiota bacterium]|nr:PSD1 and planctomycete cytochrome C domain-containing protein [Verrucomicrobiota bacterium]
MATGHPFLQAQDKPVDFAREILPVLSDKCFVCHGPDTKKKDLVRLDSFAGATRDLDGYKAINPEAPAESEIIARINDADDPMPPQEAEKQLNADERRLIERWIKQGGKYAKHWAFVHPAKPTPPSKGHPVDAFVKQHFPEGTGFAEAADRSTLARRLALVLTGLPPEPELLDSYLSDDSNNAYERLVEQLLANPRYGEHQARYWLDAVRYGDTHGLHLDNKRGIYPYRDWVVRALNSNLPLDRFIEWQLAGDLHPNPTIEQLIATGYVRMNPSTAEGGVIPAEFQAKNNFDRTETLGTVFLGMTMICSRCHTHKYDPITQTEYYQLMAFFNSTAEGPLDGNKYEYAPVIKVPQDQVSWNDWKRLQSERDQFLAEAALTFENPQEFQSEAKQKWDKADKGARLTMIADENGLWKKAGETINKTAKRLAKRIDKAEKAFTTTLVAKELSKPRETKLLQRGEYNLPTGESLQPGVLNVMGSLPKGAPRNRLGLAKWLTSRDQPVVSRVLVNRIWQRVFGEGLVRTPEDFGLQGQHPTHPKLLDWLAVELQDSNWDLKHMLRLMVSSKTFRQSSTLRPALNDTENKLFARGPRYRLDAEVLRDIALWASELLDPYMGGEGVKPYQPAGMWKALSHPASNTKNYKADTGRMVYRRSLYVYWKRTSPHPMMTLFDAPNRESSCVKRSRTNTPLQSLGLLNETQRVEMARMLAERLLKERATDDQRLELMFTLLACREPNAAERDACKRLLDLMRERYASSQKDANDLLNTGEVPRDRSLNTTDHAAWTQLSATALASDLALMLF